MSEIELLHAFQKAVSKLGDLIEADKPVYLFTVRVEPIEPQRDDVDHSLKRGKARILVKERSRNSAFNAIVEVRGRTLVLSRLNGEYDLADLAKRLDIEYSKRYPKERLKLDRVLKDGRVRHYIVTNPEHFFGFLHFIHNVPLEIYTQQGEHAMPKWIHWINEKNLRRQARLSASTSE